MMTGTITASREALFRLRVFGPIGQDQEIEATLDTGFNDYFTLPPDVVSALNLPYEASTLATLADGSVLQLDYYRVTVLWNGKRRSVPVLATSGEPLIGMSLLYGHRVILDVIDGGSVSVEPIS